MPRRVSRPSDVLASVSRLTTRDDQLLRWLAEHYVMGTRQIAGALFPSYRAACTRLKTLHEFGAVARFSGLLDGTGRAEYQYTLGALGVKLYPAAYHHPDRPAKPATAVTRALNIRGSARVQSRHLHGVNQFFLDLYAHSRTDPGSRLLRWWSEQHATATFSAYPAVGIRPDGHGIWASHRTVTGFFLEHDRGTEPLGRVLNKLIEYTRLATAGTGPAYPVLLHVPTPGREKHLLTELQALNAPITVATTIHSAHPAGPVWAVPGHRRRYALHELPSQHGPVSPLNPARYGTDPADLAPPV